MNPKKTTPSPLGITPGDVYYILFRHKWLIAGLLALTAAAVFVMRSQCNVPYVSEAKIMIKYVHDSKAPVPFSNGESAPPTYEAGINAVNSEIEVLTSADLAADVVDVLGAGKILAKVDGSTNRTEAINIVKGGLQPSVNRSDVVILLYSHPDPEMVKPVLSQLITAYMKKHHEIHQGTDNVDSLQKQVDETTALISEKEKQIGDLKSQAGIPYTTVTDGLKKANDDRNELGKQALEAANQLTSQMVDIQRLQIILGKVIGTNNTVSNTVAAIPPDKMEEYKRVCHSLSTLESTRDDLLSQYTPSSPQYLRADSMVQRVETQKRALENNYPALTNVEPASTTVQAVDPRALLAEKLHEAEGLKVKVEYLTSERNAAETNAARISSFEYRIAQLESDKAMEQQELTYYSQQLAGEKVKVKIGSDTNISPVEDPTDPARDMSKFNKIEFGIIAVGLILALGLPFLIEMYLDRTLKRPIDVQNRLGAPFGLPFFISIPQLNGNFARPQKGVRKAGFLTNGSNGAKAGTNGDLPLNGNGSPPLSAHASGQLAIWERSDGLQPFYETLRDRLMTYFEVINLTHKPKLVAVTSCGEGAGVTTTAAGLASSLSETGDGNVLLVNMNVRDGEAQHFYKGKLTCNLDDVLEKGTRDSAFVQGNLYVAEGGAEDQRLPRVLPKRFSHLLPKMKASDFDYIIFDMPPVNQISITPRLARFMDMVLLVVESGKTDRDVAARAAAVLTDTKTNVGVILNRNRSYGPNKQHQEI